MAKTQYVDIDPELEEKFFEALTPQDRFTVPRLTRKVTFFSLEKVKGLTLRSYLPVCSKHWQGFSDAQRSAWKDVSPFARGHGWRTFVKDQCKRIKYGLAGTATPSEHHNAFVGKLKIASPASEIKIAQYHPETYYIQQKVAGSKSQYEPVKVTEPFSLPLELKIHYKSNLSAAGSNPSAKFYARVWSSYQAQDIYTDCEINLSLSSGWTSATQTLSNVTGYIIGYTLYFHLYDLTGELFFDNLEVNHSSQNWVRDPFCDNISKTFTRVYYQVPKHWASVVLPSGSEYGSVYPT